MPRCVRTPAARGDHAVARRPRKITNEYKAGTVSYLNVITAQTTALANERTAIGILAGRMVDTIRLVEAMGGGWDTADLPAVALTGDRLAVHR